MDKVINFLDLKKQYHKIKEEIKSALSDVCEATAFSDGSFVKKFEADFANYCNVNFTAGLNSGTSALHLAMLALGIRQGDEVIVPANSFIATAWGPSYAGATPVFVDCTPDTWNIDPQAIEKKITKRTKAIIGVHLYGQPFDIDPVKKISDEYNINLIEDCAQAHGAKYNGMVVGGLSEMGCFSFYPGKNLGAYGEGGAIVTNNPEYDRHIRNLRNHGSSVKYYHDELGFNMRMDGFQGAVLSIKLKYLDIWNNRRKEIAEMYRNLISVPQIRTQAQPEWSDSVYHLFIITVEKRDEFLQCMKKSNINCGLHYPVPCHLQKAYSHLGYKEGDCPNSEYLAKHCVSLPMYAELTDEEVHYIIDTINEYQ